MRSSPPLRSATASRPLLNFAARVTSSSSLFPAPPHLLRKELISAFRFWRKSSRSGSASSPVAYEARSEEASSRMKRDSATRSAISSNRESLPLAASRNRRAECKSVSAPDSSESRVDSAPLDAIRKSSTLDSLLISSSIAEGSLRTAFNFDQAARNSSSSAISPSRLLAEAFIALMRSRNSR